MGRSRQKDGRIWNITWWGLLALSCFLYTCAPAPQDFEGSDQRLIRMCPELEYGQGVVNVRDCGFTTSKQFPLHRNWRLHWGELPNKATGVTATEGTPIALLNYWGRLKQTGGQSHGYATYTTTVIAPVSGTQLGITVPEIRSAYTLYANGGIVGQGGKVGSGPEDYAPGYGNRIVALPIADTLRLTIAVANYSHRFGGLHRAPHLGAYELLRKVRTKNSIKSAIFQSLTFFIALINLLLFAYYRREQGYLYFGLTALAVLMRQLSVNEMLILEGFPGLSWKTVHDLRYIGFYLGIVFGSWYYRILFPDWIARKWVVTFTALGAASTIFVLFTPTYIGGWSSPMMQVATLIQFCYVLNRIFYSWRAKVPDSGISLIGLMLFSLVFFHDLLVVNHILLTPLIISSGFILLVMVQAIVLAKRYQRIHQQNEKLGSSLIVANRELEQKVADRTNELAVKNRRLEEVKQFKEKMVRMMVHDMKNPLNIVLGINRDHAEEGKKNTYLAAQRMEKMVQNFLKLSEYETGKLRLQPAPCALNDILDYVESQLVGLREQHGVSLVRDYVENPVFVADEPLMERILINLLANAIMYSLRGGVVTIRYAWRDDEFYLEVEDQGRGIPLDQQQHIFQEFVRLEDHRESTGLGLAFCKVAIESHGGTLNLISSLGKGATFFFTLPGARPQVQGKAARQQIVLYAEERAFITPHLSELLATPMYRISRFQELINAIDCSESEGITAWKRAVLTACYREDEEDLMKLLSVLKE